MPGFHCQSVTSKGIDTFTLVGSILSQRYASEMNPISCKRHRFPPDIIPLAVWLHARFTLSFRDVEDMLAERGVAVSNEIVRRWFLKFGGPIVRNLRRARPRANDKWHLDEMVIQMRGKRYWLWRAVDDEGEVLDFIVQPRRCGRSASKLLRGLLKKHGFSPTKIVTDKLQSWPNSPRTWKRRMA